MKKGKIVALIIGGIILVVTIIIAIIISIFLVNWYQVKKLDKLKEPLNYEQMQKYVNYYYGPAELVKRDKIENGYKYTYKDEEYGFEYEASSYTTHELIVLFKLANESNFKYKYAEYIKQNIELDNVLRDKSYPGFEGYIVLPVKVQNPDNPEAELKQVVKALKEYERKDVFEDAEIAYCDSEGNLKGYYRIKNGKITTFEASKWNDINKSVAQYVTGSYLKTFELQLKEYGKVQLKDVEGLNIEWINEYDEKLTEEDWAAIYVYEYEGNSYFVIDKYVYIPEGTPGYEDGFRGYFNSYKK